jgi:hypothetical protein
MMPEELRPFGKLVYEFRPNGGSGAEEPEGSTGEWELLVAGDTDRAEPPVSVV